eukprot:TRINITY_DN66067_c1_g1_i1.p1 TRINITY_DN66067_c1_g1~~TRINITY_DN66067_c1_g1_i1.p1  ORF type:complete len:555 (+),score=48.12 TRINITY_DN66067_c1_g1_i1:135-1667(+)
METECAWDRYWSHPSPVCQAIACVPPKATFYAQFEDPEDEISNHTFESTVTFMCPKGYKMKEEDQPTIRCAETGTWLPDPPSCLPPSMGSPTLTAAAVLAPATIGSVMGGLGTVSGAYAPLPLMMRRCGFGTEEPPAEGEKPPGLANFMLQPLHFIPVSDNHNMRVLATTFIVLAMGSLLHFGIVFVVAKAKKVPVVVSAAQLQFPNAAYVLIAVTYSGVVLASFDLVTHGKNGGAPIGVAPRVVGSLTGLLMLAYPICLIFVGKYLTNPNNDRCITRPFDTTPVEGLHLHPDYVPKFTAEKILPKYYWFCPSQPSLLGAHSLLISTANERRMGYLSEPLHLIILWVESAIAGMMSSCGSLGWILLIISIAKVVLFLAWRPYNSLTKSILLACMQGGVCLTLFAGSIMSIQFGVEVPAGLLAGLGVISGLLAAGYLLYAALDTAREMVVVKKLAKYDQMQWDGELESNMIIPTEYSDAEWSSAQFSETEDLDIGSQSYTQSWSESYTLTK